MAGRPKSGITADTDVNLDFLTKEEKEALLSKKMDMIRQRNKMLTERHEMIEADRRKAEESGNAVKALDSKTLPAEGVPNKPRGRGRGQGQGSHRDGNRSIKDRPKSHGDTLSYEPIVDVSDFTVHRLDNNRNKGKGGQHHQDRDVPTLTPKNRRKPHQKEEAGFRQAPPSTVTHPAMAFDYEPIVDLNDLDHRFGARSTAAASKQMTDSGNHNNNRGYNAGHARSNRRSDPPDNHNKSKPYDGRLKGHYNPPPDPSFNPLSDWRRGGADKKEVPERSEHKRHPRNYGGAADLSKVKDSMKTMREKEKERPQSSRPLEMVMTGRERKNHEQWKQERDRYDNERIQRQMGDGGGWKREWDYDKIVMEHDNHSRMEPAKRPAGRIGSGRFDRGDREDHPKATANRDGKGGAPQRVQSPPNGPNGPSSHHHTQHQQPPPTPQHAPISPQSPTPLQHGDQKAPRAKGRGRGRGRGRGAGQGQGSGPGERSPRPRTWSGGDDRFVECQKEMLVVKFDNTAGDNSVEVEYEDGEPLSPTPSSKSSGSTPGRGPTGRTPNQGGGSGGGAPRSNTKGGRQSSKQDRSPQKGKIGSGRVSGQQQQQQQQHQQKRVHHQDQFVDADWDNGPVNYRHSYDGSKVRTSSHSQSQGDSEEWEDCTESSGAPEEDGLSDGHHQNLHLECQLNPEAPEFLPTSPDFLKTPPGHVKVLNWAGAGSNSPTSPQSNLSQPVLSPLSPRQQEKGSDHSSFSSPGSSASTRARNRREEMDAMPEPDEPLPPPFLLEAEMSRAMSHGENAMKEGEQSVKNVEDDNDDDDENERFEDTVDDVQEDGEKEATQNLKENSKAQETKVVEESKPDINEESPCQESLSVDDDINGTSSQPISNGHENDQDIASTSLVTVNATESERDKHKNEEEAEASQLPCGEPVSETTPVSEPETVIKTDCDGQKEEVNSSSDPPASCDSLVESPKKTEAIVDDGIAHPVHPETDPESDKTKSDGDQDISTDIAESNTDSQQPQPTAEHSDDS